MKKYSAKYLTKYALFLGFINPNVWYNRQDGWWIEADPDIEQYLGVWSSEAKNNLKLISTVINK